MALGPGFVAGFVPFGLGGHEGGLSSRDTGLAGDRAVATGQKRFGWRCTIAVWKSQSRSPLKLEIHFDQKKRTIIFIKKTGLFQIIQYSWVFVNE
jgi:hypothetical protein